MRNSYSSTPFPGSFAPYAVSEAPWGHSQRKPVLYRVVRAVTIVAVLSGVVVGLHRNDLLREGARRLGHEAKYMELERRLIGVPGYGTPRSVEANLHAAPAAPAAAIAAAPAPELTAPPSTPEPAAEAAQVTPPVAPAPQAVAAAAPPEPAPAAKLEPPPAAPAAPEPVDPLKPISLDQLPVLRSGQASAKTLAPSEPSTPVAAAPRTSAKVQVFDLDGDSPKAKKAKAKPEKVEKVEKAAAPKPAPKAKAKEPDPTAPRAGDNPLKAAIRDAMRKQGTK
jgi:hypothetical protein